MVPFRWQSRSAVNTYQVQAGAGKWEVSAQQGNINFLSFVYFIEYVGNSPRKELHFSLALVSLVHSFDIICYQFLVTLYCWCGHEVTNNRRTPDCELPRALAPGHVQFSVVTFEQLQECPRLISRVLLERNCSLQYCRTCAEEVLSCRLLLPVSLNRKCCLNWFIESACHNLFTISFAWWIGPRRSQRDWDWVDQARGPESINYKVHPLSPTSFITFIAATRH